MAQASAHGLHDEPFDPTELSDPRPTKPEPDNLLLAVQKPKIITNQVIIVNLADTDGRPQLLLGVDPARMRVLARASVVDVFVGSMETLSSYSYGGTGTVQQGYPLPTQQDAEFKTTQELYVRYEPAAGPTGLRASVFLYVERDGGYNG